MFQRQVRILKMKGMDSRITAVGNVAAAPAAAGVVVDDNEREEFFLVMTPRIIFGVGDPKGWT